MTVIDYLREDEAHVSLHVNGVAFGDGNSWATWSGGKKSAAGSKTRPGGMAKSGEKAQGGPATRADLTLTIQNSPTMFGQHAKLESLVGKGKCLVTVQYLDEDGNTISGASFPITGKLKEASLPDYNFEGNAVGMYTVVVDCDEVAAV